MSTQTARALKDGERPSIAQELAFDTSSRNTQSADRADERFQSAQVRGDDN